MIAGFLVVGVTAAVYFALFYKIDYVIPGVSPITLYNSLDSFHVLNRSGVSDVVSILKYWGEQVDVFDEKQIGKIEALFDPVEGPNARAMREYFEQRGFNFEIVFLPNTKALKRYINAKVRTPLLTSLPFALDEPNLLHYATLIGVKEKSGTVILHHFTKGNNTEISLEEYEKLWSVYPYSSLRHRYFVIQPKNFAERLARLPKDPPSYAPRSPLAFALDPILADWSVAVRGAFEPQFRVQQIQRIERMLAHPAFQNLHPRYQVVVYALLAEAQLRAGLVDQAQATIVALEGLNRDLNRPFGEWPRYHALKVATPYRVLSRYYTAVGDAARAESYTRKASETLAEIETDLRRAGIIR